MRPPQNQQHVEEQHKASAEKAALIDAIKMLNRELCKLETFKKNLLAQINEGGEVRRDA